MDSFVKEHYEYENPNLRELWLQALIKSIDYPKHKKKLQQLLKVVPPNSEQWKNLIHEESILELLVTAQLEPGTYWEETIDEKGESTFELRHFSKETPGDPEWEKSFAAAKQFARKRNRTEEEVYADERRASTLRSIIRQDIDQHLLMCRGDVEAKLFEEIEAIKEEIKRFKGLEDRLNNLMLLVKDVPIQPYAGIGHCKPDTRFDKEKRNING